MGPTGGVLCKERGRVACETGVFPHARPLSAAHLAALLQSQLGACLLNSDEFGSSKCSQKHRDSGVEGGVYQGP